MPLGVEPDHIPPPISLLGDGLLSVLELVVVPRGFQGSAVHLDLCFKDVLVGGQVWDAPSNHALGGWSPSARRWGCWFLKGLCRTVCRLKTTYRKSVTLILTSVVILRLCQEQVWHLSFFYISTSGPGSSTARPRAVPVQPNLVLGWAAPTWTAGVDPPAHRSLLSPGLPCWRQCPGLPSWPSTPLGERGTSFCSTIWCWPPSLWSPLGRALIKKTLLLRGQVP